MRVGDPLSIYNDPYARIPQKINKNGENGTSVAKTENKRGEFNNLNNKNANQVLTRPERDFFIKMFPENSQQLEKHVLFTRSGKLQTPTINKGSLVDGKA